MASDETLSRLNFVKEESNTLGILVIGNELFCTKLCEALQKCSKNKSYKLYLVTCFDIKEVLHHTDKLQVDCVIFLLDTRLRSCATDVEHNLQRMDKSFLCGRTYIVNANPHLPLSETNEKLYALTALLKKYNAPLLNGNIMDAYSCENLASRLLTIIQANLGIQQKSPYLPWIFKENN